VRRLHAALINPGRVRVRGLRRHRPRAHRRAAVKPDGQKDPNTGEDLYSATTTLPIDASTVPAIRSGDTRPSTGAADLTRYIVESGKTPACFARQYFRFTYKRTEEPDRRRVRARATESGGRAERRACAGACRRWR